MRVLIVEDMADQADLMAEIVRSQGHDPIVVATAEAALDGLRTSLPDAVLLDLYLPGMKGAEFLRELSDRRLSIPVVAVSGVASEEEARHCLQLGAVEFLPKPFHLEDLRFLLQFLELGLFTRRLTQDLATVNRRRSPRLAVSLQVTVDRPEGEPLLGESVDLSPFGLKMRLAAQIQPNGLVRLLFSPPDGDQPIAVLSLVVREDPDGSAVSFVDLTHSDFERLKKFVDLRHGRP